MKHEKLKARALSRPEVKAEYNALESEFSLLEKILKDREKAGLCQAEAIVPVKTEGPAVS